MLNYNHLRYFWIVGREGHLTRAAEKLNLSQSALSAQIKTLEGRLGVALFERRGRGLVLSQAGQLAMDYCETIFSTGDQLLNRLKGGQVSQPPLRIGALSTLSRNFQMRLLGPLLDRNDVQIVLRSGTMKELLAALQAHHLDLVLVNQVPHRDAATPWIAQVIDAQPVSLIGTTERVKGRTDRMELLCGEPLILPGQESGYRNDIDLLLSGLDAPARILAEVDDMAMLRLLARSGAGLAVLPPVVVRDELTNGELVEACQLPDVVERFSALRPTSAFAHPLVADLLGT